MRSKKVNPVSELYAEVAGSYEELQSKIRSALRSTTAFGAVENQWDISLEATLPDYVIVSVYNPDGEDKTYRADWVEDDGAITFDNVKPVRATTVVKAIAEEKKALMSERGEADMSEIFISPISFALDEEATASKGKDVYIGRVKVAQKADTLNRNKRFYPAAVLTEAVHGVNQKIDRFGPLPMDYLHREKNGKNYRDLRETAAVIHEVKFDEVAGEVSLENIRLVNTAAGTDVKALLDAGMRLQVSQRGTGLSEIVKDTETGEVMERVTKLTIDSWDLLAGGDASVLEADFEFDVISEAINMPEKEIATKDDVQEMIDSSLTDNNTTLLSAFKDMLKEEKDEEDEDPKPADEADPKPEDETDPKPADEADPKPEDETDPKPADAPPDPRILAKVTEADNRLAVAEQRMAGIQKKADMADLSSLAKDMLSVALTEEAYDRFSDSDKEFLTAGVSMEALYESIDDVTDEGKVNEALTPLLSIEVTGLDRVLAQAKLAATGYTPGADQAGGTTHVEVISEGAPWMENFGKLKTAVMERMSGLLPAGEWRAPDDHAALKVLKEEVMPLFDRENFRHLNEADEEVTQLDIGPRVALIARVVIDAAWRTLTALSIYDVGTQTARIEDAPVKEWLPAEGADRITYMNAIHVAEQGTFPLAGVKYVNYPIYAIKKGIRSQLTSESKATARGTSMNPLADTIAGMAVDVRNRLDLELWYMLLARSFAQNATEVTAFKACTDLGSDVWQLTSDGTVAITGIVPFEWYKKVDANGNPTDAMINKLYATPSANTLQDLQVQEAGGDNTDLIYETDYGVDWNTGKITLTASGVTKEATNGLQAKLTYTSNIVQWNLTPDAGVQLYDWLINLRQKIGEAKVIVGNRHYQTRYLAMCLETEDLITSGKSMEMAGSRPSDILDRLNNVIAYAGLTPIKTSALPQDWLLLGEGNSGVYRVHTPWSVNGPITSETTNDQFYMAEEFSGNDAPVADKMITVGIQNLAIPFNEN